MKTLIIHPKDKSTDFLIPIYKGMHNKTVVTGGKTWSELHELIKTHDRVIMMGHGWTYGLFNVSDFKTGSTVIDMRMVKTLLEKKENIFIWCHAHTFVDNFKLKGFNTGMFISEVGEASWFNIHTTQKKIDTSNNLFVDIVKKYRTKDGKTIHRKVYEGYGKLAETCEVAQYNHQRLYINE